MTKAEFDDAYKNRTLAVHMPDKVSAQYLFDYVNILCGTRKQLTFSIRQFPYLMYFGDRQVGWTGCGDYVQLYSKISFDEFYRAINKLNEEIDTGSLDLSGLL